jgi:hypothetical protein
MVQRLILVVLFYPGILLGAVDYKHCIEAVSNPIDKLIVDGNGAVRAHVSDLFIDGIKLTEEGSVETFSRDFYFNEPDIKISSDNRVETYTYKYPLPRTEPSKPQEYRNVKQVSVIRDDKG